MQEAVESQSWRVLELPAVLGQVAALATWSLGRERVLALRPFADRESLLRRQQEVSEAIRLDMGFTTPPLHGVRDVAELARAAGRGAVLEPQQILDVAQTLDVAVRVRRFLLERRDDVPLHAERGAVLVPLPHLVEEVGRCLLSDGNVRDDATPRLHELKIQIRTLENRIQGQLQRILRNPAHARMFQEPYVTTRQDRFVLPIKAEYRSQFPGLVLDASASGATVFMEPWSIVDAGNQLREARLAEAHEIQKLLARLSERLGKSEADIISNGVILGELDALGALARYAAQQRGVLPEIDVEPRVRLVGARHPLLGERAVPVDIELGPGTKGEHEDFRVLIITGPNTGGKTVTLKTIGLFALMTMSAIPIPASPDSRLGFLEGVFADIGDEQSISQNLSTFSSHVSQISRIVPQARPGTLVLLDEAGAGTDPREGTALAIAIIEFLHQQGALVVATTHYNELKAFAAHFEGAENAAMEFNPETLEPTYRIHTGLPGRSLALAICERFGLPPNLLGRARELLGTTHFSVEDLLVEIEHQRDQAERSRHLADRAHSEAEVMREQARHRLDEITVQREKLVLDAAREAERLLEQLRSQSRGLMEEARGLVRELSTRVEEAETGEVGTGGEESKPAASDTREIPTAGVEDLQHRERDARRRLEQLQDQLEDLVDQGEQVRATRADRSKEPPQFEPGPIRKGDTVFVQRFKQEGIVVEDPRGSQVQVKIGPMHATVPLEGVQRVRAQASPGTQGPAAEDVAAVMRSVSRQATVSTRLDLRGMRAEDAAYEVSRYLDEVAHANVPSVTIVHGKGTGVLLHVVHEQLRAHGSVDSFRLGDAPEGGWGVTVVNLK